MAASSWLLALALRATLVLLVALVLATFLRRRTALGRHRLLTLTAIGLLLLPALPELLPRWETALVPAWMGRASEASRTATEAPRVVAAARGEDRAPAGVPITVSAEREILPTRAGVDSVGPGAGSVLFSVWLLGVLASLWGLARGLRRERRLLAAARPIGGEWLEALAETRQALALRGTVRLLRSQGIETPLTGGWLRPAVLLPDSADAWSAERRHVVLQHELVHVARADGWRHLAWRVVGAVYWFHPLARLAARQAGIAREEACDEAVLRLGNRPSAYAGHLLAIAESLGSRPVTLASALPMVERTQLERRLLVILAPDRFVGRGRGLAAGTLAALACLVIGVSAASPRPGPGSVVAEVAPRPAVAARPEVAPRAPVAPGAAAISEGGACLTDIKGSFEGTFTQEGSTTDLNGTHNGDFVVQQHLGRDQRICARVHGAVRFDERNGSILEMPSGASMDVETRQGRESRRMVVTGDGGERRYQWSRNGVTSAPDDAARAWFGDALEVVAGFRQIGAIHGKVGSLQGEIGSIQGEVGSLQGEIGSIQGEQGSLQGRLGSIQGEEGSLQGEIGSHQGAIGSLEGKRWQADAAAQARIDREIQRQNDAIAKLQAEKAARGFVARLAAAQEELRKFDAQAQGRIADIERRIRDVRAEERIARLEDEIRNVRAEERVAEIERRIQPALERLKALTPR